MRGRGDKRRQARQVMAQRVRWRSRCERVHQAARTRAFRRLPPLDDGRAEWLTVRGPSTRTTTTRIKMLFQEPPKIDCKRYSFCCMLLVKCAT